MKFKVSRSSVLDDSIQPCEEAFRDKMLEIDIRPIQDPNQLKDENLRINWYNEGSNHRTIKGFIARDIGTIESWFIEINTLEDLINFKNRNGDIIINTSEIDKQTHEIIIIK